MLILGKFYGVSQANDNLYSAMYKGWFILILFTYLTDIILARFKEPKWKYIFIISVIVGIIGILISYTLELIVIQKVLVYSIVPDNTFFGFLHLDNIHESLMSKYRPDINSFSDLFLSVLKSNYMIFVWTVLFTIITLLLSLAEVSNHRLTIVFSLAFSVHMGLIQFEGIKDFLNSL